MKNPIILTILLLAITLPTICEAQTTGEWAVQSDGSPAIIGQCVQDHIFVRDTYLHRDNIVSFISGTPQIVAFYLDDDEIYTNSRVQALTPVPCYDGGSELYKEITYNSAQFDIYLPMTMSLIKYKFPGEKRAIEAQAGDRLPYDASISWSKNNETKTIDGIEYNVYNVLITNWMEYACHFSGNVDAYAMHGGALKKDDAPLFYLAIENTNQDVPEGRLVDIIIANQEFGIREANINWGTDPNMCRYIYGTGGNNVEQRFQLYNRVTLYGSEGIPEGVFEVNGLYYTIINENSACLYGHRNDIEDDLVIPNTVSHNGTNYSVTSIRDNAFEDCTGLSSVTIPNSVTVIGGYAFSGCTGLNSVTIPNSVTSIGNGAFSGCTGLTSFCIPNSVTSISNSLFYNCSSLTNVNIPNFVTGIGGYAFSGCTGLNSVTIPNSVTSIGYGAFSGCTGLNSVTIPNSVTSIGNDAFSGCTGLNSVTIPNSVTSIGNGAFSGCTGLNSVTIPNSVTSISNSLFYNCRSLTNVNIPSTVTSIGNSAFQNCSGLTNVEIPNSVITIGRYAFNGCYRLKSVTIGNAVTSIESYAFERCFALETLNFNAIYCENFSSIDNERPFNGLNISTISIGDGVQRVPAYFACNLTKVKEITIPSSVISIGSQAFKGCSALETLNFNAINCNNFSNTGRPFIDLNISTINIGDGVQRIPAYFAYGLTKVKEITIPNTVTSIGTQAFYNNDNIIAVTCEAETPPMLNSNDVFTSYVYNNTPLYVPKNCKNAYLLDSNWGQFLTIISEQTVTSISLNYSSLNLYVDDTSQLLATVLPEDATNKTVIWESSNSSIATVDNDGLVTAVAPGTAIISATTTDDTNLSATCFVTVQNRLVTSLSLNKDRISLYVNQTSQLTASIYPSDATNKTVSWESSDASVATVNNNGFVTAIAAGTATITATTTDGSNLSASCEVTVSIIPVTSVSLNKTRLTLDINDTDTYQLIGTITPSNATYKTLTWSSSNPAVAIVSNNGLVTLVSTGEATITATTTDGTNLSASCQVTVVKRIKSITLNENGLTLTLPQTTQLVAFITPSDATNQTLNWTSSNTSVATVDANGFITSVGVGTTTIKATTTDGTNLSATCQVTVNKQYVTSITLNENSQVMHIGETLQLIANVQPENASYPTISWSSGNSSVARVDNNGLVTAVAGGTTYIKASATDGSHVYANCSIEVIPDYYITLDTLSHIRGGEAQVVDLPVSLVNKNPISGIQFDVSLPNGIEFNLVDGEPDVWLDEARGTRSHSISASQLSNGNYRILVTSSTSRDLRGNDGVLVHMNMLLPQQHDTGNRYINVSNIIASEADETRHTLDNKSTVVHLYYIVGDADANAIVDIADHAATASKILGKSPSPFYYNAANVDNNSSLDVVDLVGITNIALQIKPITVRQAPARGYVENFLYCDQLRLNGNDEAEINIGMDCGFDFAGFQMDVILPRGLNLLGTTLGDEAARLGLAIETMPDGSIRILGTSFSDAEISGLCPKLITLRVKADRNYMPGSNLEFNEILFAERNLTSHYLDGASILYVEPSTVYELMDEARIYVENDNIIVETPVAGTVQIIAIDGRMIESQANVGRNVYAVAGSGIFIVKFNGKTIKVRI